ncbi:hypothetical protein LINGRAHAP2_LOCUS33765 [Linum grandiflorum]
MTGEKRVHGELRQEEHEVLHKRVKSAHLISVLKGKGSDFTQIERSGTTITSSDPVKLQIDLNREACETDDSINEGLPDEDQDNCSVVVNRCNLCVTSSSIIQIANRDRVSSSSRYGGIPMPKRAEKDRFTKIAAPSGLLSKLSPGIMNHVRNSTQVRNIIESLAKSDTSTDSNNQSADANDVSRLALRAASVASEWLNLLRQDIQGRLIALQRSKNRVRDVVTTELPRFTSEKLSVCNEENAAMHKKRWTKLFDQMDTALSQQQVELESLLNQLKEMQVHCNKGLEHSARIPRMRKHYSRNVDKESYEKEMAVRAAAGSIYSTCKFVMSTKEDDVACF